MSSDTLLRHPLTRAAEASPAVVPALPGRRLLALAGETVTVLAPLLVVPLLGLTGLPLGWAWAAGSLGVVAAAAALAGDLTRTGRTPVRRLLGLRTVALDGELPPGPAALLGRRVVTADLRAGRDPLLIVPGPPQPRTRGPRTAEPRPGWRPPVTPASGTWRLELDDGGEFELTRSTLLGRDPRHSDGDAHALLAIPDLSRSISRVHALVEPAGDCLWLTDVGATNGTRAASPSASGGTVIERWLRPGERAAVRAGGTIHLGDRVLRVTRSTTTSSRRAPGAPRGD